LYRRYIHTYVLYIQFIYSIIIIQLLWFLMLYSSIYIYLFIYLPFLYLFIHLSIHLLLSVYQSICYHSSMHPYKLILLVSSCESFTLNVVTVYVLISHWRQPSSRWDKWWWPTMHNRYCIMVIMMMMMMMIMIHMTTMMMIVNIMMMIRKITCPSSPFLTSSSLLISHILYMSHLSIYPPIHVSIFRLIILFIYLST